MCSPPQILRSDVRVHRRWIWRIAPIILVVAVIAFGAISITSTYRIFAHTVDEPAHLAAGIELLDRGTYRYEQQHPPLARLAVAIGPYLLGARSHGKADIFDEGLAVLYQSSDYAAVLSAARFGVLPFFVTLVAIACVWAYRDFGVVAAVATAAILATTPPVLTHAGLATTDIPVAAMFVSALFAFRLWLKSPSIGRGALVGATAALAVTSKLSALAFLPASFACTAALYFLCNRERRPRPLTVPDILLGLAAGIGTSALAIYLVYGCPADPTQPFRQLSAGVTEVLEHNAKGHVSFFCGLASFSGKWLFFPTVLAVKTPLPFLCLFGIAAFVILRDHRQDWRYLAPLASAAALLGIAMLSHLNLGSRYLLPLYPLTAIIAGSGAAYLLRTRAWGSVLVGGLLIGQVSASAGASPDYLAYFNPLAGAHPEKLLVDSDLDWGQDVNRVVTELQKRGITQVATALHSNADLSRHGFPPYSEMEWDEPTTGWIAISLTRLAFGQSAPPFDGYRWLERYTPVATIGKTVRLYHIEAEKSRGSVNQ